VLTPLRATWLVIILAAITHARRREPNAIAVNAVLLAGPYASYPSATASRSISQGETMHAFVLVLYGYNMIF